MGIIGGTFLEGYYEQFLNHSCHLVLYIADSCVRVFVAYSFIVIGYLLFPFIKNILVRVTVVYRIITGIGALITGFGLSTLSDKIVDLHFGYVRNPVMTYLASIILFISFVMTMSTIHSDKLSWIGKNTLTLMGLQIGTVYTVKIINYCAVKLGISADSVVVALVSLLIFMFIAVCVTRIVNRYFRWIMVMPNILKLCKERNSK